MNEKIIKAAKEWEGISLLGEEGKDIRRAFIKECASHGQQSVHTSFVLAGEMISKLKEYSELDFVELANRNIAVLFNSEFVEVLISDYKVPAENITFFADSKTEQSLVKEFLGTKTVLIMPEEKDNTEQIKKIKALKEKHKDDETIQDWCKEKLKELKGNTETSLDKLEKYIKENNMKFDCVIMNPPYQADSGEKNAIWHKFVELSIDNLIKDNGYLCAVHPSNWRFSNTFSSVGTKMKEKQIEYLEMHDNSDGIKTFGASTTYDWYVMKNKNN